MIPPAVHPFLLAALRGADPVPPLAPALGDGDWEEIARDASAQGLTPFLYRWIRRAEVGQRVPEGLRARLEAQSFGLAARNMMLAEELGSVLRALAEGQVPCVPLRGLALAERLYGDITARPMGDLDLLVRKGDLPHVVAVLSGLGFREMDRRPGFARAFGHTLEFYKDRHGWIMVEPHWTIAYPPFADRVDMEEVWGRCVRGRVVGVEAWVLGREELLLHLCLHLAHRGETAPLLWVYELDRLVRQEREALDWSRCLALARGAGVESLLAESLETARTLFASPVPAEVFEELARRPRGAVAGRMARLLGGASRVDGKESLAVLFTVKGLRAKLRYALALLFPCPAFMRIEYGLTHGRQLGLAYCRRLCRLAREGLKGVATLLFQRPKPRGLCAPVHRAERSHGLAGPALPARGRARRRTPSNNA